MVDEKQFYPTPSALAYRAFQQFKNKDITRLLEPSAGVGSLLKPVLDSRQHLKDKIDCIEIDLNNQAILREQGLTVVDGDFMQFDGAPMYSHCLMNPPFKNAVDHVIKAFNLLIHGELVAIVNAETIKNPCSKKKQLLVDWIAEYGSVEFIESAFTEPDTLRRTQVEVALIHLEKKTDIKQNFTHGLELDKNAGVTSADKQELAIRGSTINNAVAMFNAAVAALKTAEIAQQEANYYSALLGSPLNKLEAAITPLALATRFNEGYAELKNRAWSNILNSTEFSKYLSSKAYQKLVADFAAVSALSFTESNIRGFLVGLVNAQGDMNMQMLLDCFDEITKYRPENRAYYRGWKSNTRHAEQSYRVQMTRFIIPSGHSYSSHFVEYGTLKKLEDFDKAFTLLDGKASCSSSLRDLFDNRFPELRQGKRLSTSYFDIRWYPGVGSIHFFPTNKGLIDRLNRMVGKARKWIPQDHEQAPDSFWQQYDQAERVTKAMDVPVSRWGQLHEADLPAAHLTACDKLGLDISNLLTHDKAA